MIRELECPYGDDFEGGDECDRCEQYELCMETYPPVNLIEIPKGATNGDMIKAMFDCQEDENQWGDGSIWVTFRAKNNPSYNFDLSWWNAPYKKAESEG